MSEQSEWVFLQANLKTRVNYFSVNNQINCLLHFHPHFTFEFSHSTNMTFYQNSSSHCMNFKRHGLVWKLSPSCFHLMQKINHVLKIQTQKCHKSFTWLSRKSYFIFVLQGFLQKCQLDMKIAVWFPWFYQIFRKKSTILIVFTNNINKVPSNYDVKTFKMK